MNQLVTALYLAAATPSPSEQPFDPVDVTPGPIGFFATAALFIAVGLVAMSLMRRSIRANARFDMREQLEREEAERLAQAPAEGTSTADGTRDATTDQPDAGHNDGDTQQEPKA